MDVEFGEQKFTAEDATRKLRRRLPQKLVYEERKIEVEGIGIFTA
jgi:hypothetical protein